MNNASVSNQVVSRMIAALVNKTSAGDRVFESREAAFSRGEMPCIVVAQPESEDTMVHGGDVDQNTLLISVSVLVRAERWRAEADPLAVAAHNILTHDAQLQAMVVDMRKRGRKWESEEADLPMGCDSITYRLIYLSSSDDLTSLI
jgi:hypothetical protein